MTRKQVALIAWLCLPVLAVAALCYIMATNLSMESRAKNREMFPPRGVGAGDTGGVNAFGELLHGQKANHGTPEGREAALNEQRLLHPEHLPQGFVIVVRDGTAAAPWLHPLYLVGSMNSGKPGEAAFALDPQPDGTWRGAFTGKPDGARWKFHIAKPGPGGRELAADGAMNERTLPALDPASIAADLVPVIEFVVDRWSPPHPAGG